MFSRALSILVIGVASLYVVHVFGGDDLNIGDRVVCLLFAGGVLYRNARFLMTGETLEWIKPVTSRAFRRRTAA